MYLDGLSDLGGVDLPGIPTYPHTHAWHLFVVKIKSVDRESFMRALADNNIGYGLHFPACHRLSYIRERFGDIHLPETDALADRILSIPIYPAMSDEQVYRVIDVIKRVLG